MHPEISFFPNHYFYDGAIIDDNELVIKRNREYHKYDLFKPFLWYHVKGISEITPYKSLYNKYEIKAILNHLLYFYQIYNKDRIGIITPYLEQKHQLEYYIKLTLLKDANIEISTVDGFEGRELDIIILSLVRAFDKPINYGFLEDEKRINVSLTRSKYSLWIFGNCEYLINSKIWSKLIKYSIEYNLIRRNYELITLE